MQAFFLVLLLFPPPDNLGHLDTGPPGMTHDAVCFPAWQEYYCSQPFSYEDLENGLGFSSSENWMIADDFYYGIWGFGFITDLEIWAVYASGGPTGFTIQIRSDTGGSGPGSVFDSTVSLYVNHTDTGYSQWGYPLWHTDIALTDGILFTGGVKYWLALQTVGGAGGHYWLATGQTWADMTYFSQNNGGAWASSQYIWGTPYEQFMIISEDVSLERESWGSIKALF